MVYLYFSPYVLLKVAIVECSIFILLSFIHRQYPTRYMHHLRFLMMYLCITHIIIALIDYSYPINAALRMPILLFCPMILRLLLERLYPALKSPKKNYLDKHYIKS